MIKNEKKKFNKVPSEEFFPLAHTPHTRDQALKTFAHLVSINFISVRREQIFFENKNFWNMEKPSST